MVLMVPAASGANVSISSFLYARRTLESSSWITRWRHCRLKDSISTEEFFHREECTPLCSLIFVFKSVRKVSKKSLKKKVPTLESYEKKKKGRWISFNLKAKVSGRKFIFNESTNEIWIFRASSIVVTSSQRASFFLFRYFLSSYLGCCRIGYFIRGMNDTCDIFFQFSTLSRRLKSIRKTMTPFIPFYEGEYKILGNGSRSFSISKFETKEKFD